jgi:hypothetical protein
LGVSGEPQATAAQHRRISLACPMLGTRTRGREKNKARRAARLPTIARTPRGSGARRLGTSPAPRARSLLADLLLARTLPALT